MEILKEINKSKKNASGEDELINNRLFANSSSYLDEVEEVPLASQGWYYTGKFKNKKTIKVRKLNFMDEDLLTTEALYRDNTLIIRLLKDTVVEPGFNVEELLPCDKDGILIWLRITNLGSNYQTRHVCPKCQKRAIRTWNLEDVDYPEYSEETKEKYESLIIQDGGVYVNVNDDIRFLISPANISSEVKIKNFIDDLVITGKLSGDKNYLITGKLLSIIKKIEIKLINEENGELEIVELSGHENVYEYLYKKPIGFSLSKDIQKIAKDLELNISNVKSFACKDLKGSYSHFDSEKLAKIQREKEAKCNYVEEGVNMSLDLTTFFWPEILKG